MAKAAIQKHGNDGITALKHLRLHNQIVFGDWQATQPPEGMSIQTFRQTLNALAGSNVVTVTNKSIGPGFFETIYTLSPGVQSAMDEFLYQSNS